MKPEYKNLVLTDILAAVAAVITALIWGTRCALFLAAGALVISGLYVYEIRKREEKISRLCNVLDGLLYHDKPWNLDLYSEGELAILCDKTQKLTIRLREQAQALQREKKFQEEFMTDVSHQLKTPLTSMRLIVSRLISESDQDNAQAMELMQLISRVDTLVVTLLKMARLDSGSMAFDSSDVCVYKMISESIQPLEISMDIHGIKLHMHGSEALKFKGDFMWTQEAISNIVKNCIEHTKNGGNIDIGWRGNAMFTEIRIEDDGEGIKEEDLPHIFERFYTSKASQNGPGFGIGLAFARSVIQKQGGTIRAENNKKGGAVFIIKMPPGDCES